MQVVVQHHKRLFRDGLAMLLSAADDVTLRGTAQTTDGLLDLCRRHRPDVALLAVDTADEPYRLCRRLRRQVPGLRIVGLCGPLTHLDPTQASVVGMDVVPSESGFGPVLGTLRAVPDVAPMPSLVPMPLVGTAVRTNGAEDAPPLTARERAILVLVGGGCTSQVISHHLQISPKTVENHKQRIFAKLGVQNQAHAVVVAIREGLIRADRMMSVVD